jgi:FixJ family two-component response regulator
MTQERAGEVSADGRPGEETGESPHPWVYVVDDDPGVRRYLQRLIENSGYRVKLFPSADEFLLHHRPAEPACLVLDICLPGTDGLGLQQRLHDQGDLLPIIFITGYGSIRSSVRAMKSGAVDFLTKPLDGAEVLAVIAHAIEDSHQGWARFRHDELLKDRFAALTRREAEVIQCVAQGWLNRQIAAELGIAEKTVKVHRGRAMHKLGAKSAVELPQLLERLVLDDPRFTLQGNRVPGGPDPE